MAAKFKVGDWILADNRVYQKIEAVIEGDEIVYGLTLPKHDKSDDEGMYLAWVTEFELLDRDPLMKKVPAPDFKKYAKLKAGDVVHMGNSSDRPYITILAKVGTTVLMSGVPHGHKEHEVMEKVSEQVKELTGGEVDPMEDFFDDEDKAQMKKHSNSRYVKRIATVWKTTDWICLMNWPIVEE